MLKRKQIVKIPQTNWEVFAFSIHAATGTDIFDSDGCFIVHKKKGI
jgi:hypothetical protein